VPLFQAPFARRKSLALLRQHVDEPRAFQRPHRGEGLDHTANVVSVDRAEVAKPSSSNSTPGVRNVLTLSSHFRTIVLIDDSGPGALSTIAPIADRTRL